MAELVDALVSGASAARCRSSNLLSGTKKPKKDTMCNTLNRDTYPGFYSSLTYMIENLAPFHGGAFFIFTKSKYNP